jgi:4-hydroxybenzoate polyprenyltransferase
VAEIIRVAPPVAALRLVAFVRALRVHQWVKNLLLVVPVILDHKLLQPVYLAKAGTAFAAFCCAASGAYVCNDLLDLEADRHHPTKRHRPFAAGLLSPGFGVMLVPLLFLGAFLLSLGVLPRPVDALLALYVVVTTAYSAFLKRVAVLDVLILAGLYTLRVLAGVAATGVRFSTWLIAFSTFLFLSLAFLKRYAELSSQAGHGEEPLGRRGYLKADHEWLASMGSSSSYLSVLVLALYINSEQVVVLYHRPLLLWLACPLLLYWTSRMWMLAHRGQIHEDPIVATARDPASYAVAALVAFIMIAAM